MTALVDKKGHALIPTVVPPETAFPYPLANGSAASLKKHATRDASETDASSTDAPASAPAAARAGAPPVTGAAQASSPEPSAQKAASPRRTAASGRSERPGARPDTLGRAFTYTLDDGSDSTSSSTSSEDEGYERHKTRAKGKAGKKQAGDRRDSYKPFSRFTVGNEHFRTRGRVSKRDGRLNISVNEAANSGYLAKALGASVRHHLLPGHRNRDDEEEVVSPTDEKGEQVGLDTEDPKTIPKLNIVIIVIGSRGDIQPFIKIGKILQDDYGHRIRVATHPAFKKFVEQDLGLEFFSIGGNPSELMAFMVKNPGLIPSLDTVKAGEIGRRRTAMFEMFQGMWRACINATDDEDDKDNQKMMGKRHPFVADAIIANPVSFAHIHIAERLGIPLHMMFTFPYTPTTHFPHPLANIKNSNVDYAYTNFMSYPLVEMMTWQGLGDLVNRFRVKTLGLEPVSTLWAPGSLYRMKVPHTYMWSPSLVPKPPDWGPEIDIAGFVFLELASSYKPPEDLVKFLEAGERPVYIGFGSIVVDDPNKFTQLIFEAVKMAGVRALVNKGWGGLGGGDTPDNIYMLEDTPHDWLFPRVEAVVHHGGAGTTAIGLKCGKPTMIVPFFGDQAFWGNMVANARAGAFECTPYKKLTAEKLAEGIKQCLTDEAKKNVAEIAKGVEKEGDGAVNAVRSFHRSLPLRGEHSMRCSILEDRVAVWRYKHTSLRLSALAGELLVEKKKVRWKDLRLIRHYEWNDFEGPGEPITGVGGAIVGTVTEAAKGVGMVPVRMARDIKKREQHNRKKRKKQQREHQGGATAESAFSNAERRNAAQKDGQSAEDTRRRETETSAHPAEPEEPLVEELAHDAGHGLQKAGAAIIKAPMDLALAVAQGFHNAPRLYGDDTVRRPPRVWGLHSGLRAGRDEFVHGIHDGVTGLVYHPVRGARAGGLLGCVKGVGIGIGGFVLKDIAAVVAPVAYTLKGIHKEVTKSGQPDHFIRRARMAQGRKDARALAAGEDGGGRGGKEGEEGKEGEDGAAARDLRAVEARVEWGWRVVDDVLSLERAKKKEGLAGRLVARRERKRLVESGILENVDTTAEALRRWRRGESLDDLLDKQRREIGLAQRPRKPAMEDRGVAVGAGGREAAGAAGSASGRGGSERGREAEGKAPGAGRS